MTKTKAQSLGCPSDIGENDDEWREKGLETGAPVCRVLGCSGVVSVPGWELFFFAAPSAIAAMNWCWWRWLPLFIAMIGLVPDGATFGPEAKVASIRLYYPIQNLLPSFLFIYN